MNIGKNIIAFRKDAGMTQEELANQIGVSAQAVSKWETGVSMPDILLLPVIADVFDITVDEIYTGKREQREPVQTKHYSFNELPEMLYEDLLETDSYAWEHENEEERKKWLNTLKENMAKENRCAHFSIGDHGGAVLVNRDFALIAPEFGTKKSLEILDSDAAVPVLELLADKKVRYLFRYLIGIEGKMFTAAGLAKKTDMPEEECRSILEKIRAANLIWVKDVNVDDEEDIEVYSVSMNNTKPLYACMILWMAERLGESGEWFYGYRGMYLPVDRD